MTHSKRNIGLDYFRMIAIIFVLISHSRHLFTYIEGYDWWLLSVGGYLGVELFFVLSGFLIGRILIRKVFFSSNKLDAFKSFLIRRWFRTLPLYYLILLVYITVAFFENNMNGASWKHFIFLQNFDREALNFFAVSWSLSVEEWFYFLVPIILFFLQSLITQKENKSLLYSIVGLFFVIVIIKAISIKLYPEYNWTDVRKNIFFRFDSLLIGIIMSYIYIYHEKLFYIFGKKRVFILAISFMMAMISWYYFQRDSGLNKDFFSKVFMFPLTSIFLAVIMAYFYHNAQNETIYSYYGSRLAYSIYLIHFLFLDICIYLAHLYKKFYISIGLLILFLLVTLISSFILYRFYELPMMNLRERYARN